MKTDLKILYYLSKTNTHKLKNSDFMGVIYINGFDTLRYIWTY